MTQQDLKEYLLLPGHDCVLYEERVKEDGTFYFVRSVPNPRKMKVIYPVKRGTYSPAAVCDICTYLDVPVPEYGKHMVKIIAKVKAESDNIPQEILDKINKMKEGNLNAYASFQSEVPAPSDFSTESSSSEPTA